MEEQSLQSVMNEPESKPAPAETTVETGEPEQQAPEQAAPPAAPDPIETHRKGLEAAVLAERRKRQELEQRLAALQKPEPPAEEGPPDPAQFEGNPQEYWRQLARYEARQELKQTIETARQRQEREAEEKAAMAREARLNEVVLQGQAKYRDFDAVINGGLAPFLNQQLREAIAESEMGHEVGYWLGKNPAEAARISAMPERQMLREIAKLEIKVQAPPEPAIPRTLTQARDSRGQFAAFDGPPPLESIFKR